MKTFNITTRIDAITRIPEPYLVARLPAPRAVKIELTTNRRRPLTFGKDASSKVHTLYTY